MATVGDQELLVILHRARSLLSAPDSWSARHFAEDEAGNWVPLGSPRAVRHSLHGALIKASWRDTPHVLPQLLTLFGEIRPDFVKRLSPAGGAAPTHREVLDLLDDTMTHLSAPPARKQSGFRLNAVAQAGMPPESAKKVGR